MYSEFNRLFKDYLASVKPEELRYEWWLPVVVSSILTVTYGFVGDIHKAFLSLSSILPSVIAILIGFSITCLTILTSIDNDNIRKLKNTKCDERIICNKKISLFQLLLINFSYSLIVQIFLLMAVLFFLCINGLFSSPVTDGIMLFIEVIFTCHVFLLLVRNVVSFYFVHYKD